MKIRERGMSAISGKVDRVVKPEELRGMVPVIDAFLADEDLQEITVASANLGFALTFTKVPRRRRGKKEGK